MATTLFLDSFDHYDTSEIALKWNRVSGGNTISLVNQRTGRACLSIGGAGSGPSLTFNNRTTVVMSTAYNPFGGLGGAPLGLDSDSIGNNQIALFATSAGILQVITSFPGGTRYTVPAQFNQQQGVYVRYELKVVIAGGTGGSFELRVNGLVALAVSGINTDPTGTGHANIFSLGGLGGGADSYHDDVYLADDFLGDIIVVEQTPNADGFYTAWTPLTGVNHFAMVNEIPPDGDTSYVSSQNVGDSDTYLFPLPSFVTPATVVARQTVHYARKDLAGTRIFAPLLRQGGADFVGADQSIGLTTYTFYKQAFSVNPVTGLPWTVSDLTSCEIGERVTG